MNKEQLLLEIWALEEKVRKSEEPGNGGGDPWMGEIYRHELEKKQQELATLEKETTS